MNSINFSYFYKKKYKGGNIPQDIIYDFFFSAFDDCERTKFLYDRVKSNYKKWILFPNYQLKEIKIDYFDYDSFDEDSDIFIDFIDTLGIVKDSRICIDITGFLRPHLIYFTILLHKKYKIAKIDFLYTEPNFYIKAENTTFSGAISESPRTIKGCSSNFSNTNFEEDLLIINAGYDDKLISAITKDKSKVYNKYLILGFPSLQADMYQENILQINKSKDEIGNYKGKKFAPANDPFETANCIKEIIIENPKHSNIYLSPLSSKPQSLGMMLFYIWYNADLPLNIIFPFSDTYIPKTAIGINYTWVYTLELPNDNFELKK